MTLTVDPISQRDRTQWQTLYHGYAKFYQVPMNEEILDTVWGWIHDESIPFFGLIAKDEAGSAMGLMHCREMASPLRGALVGFLDDLFVTPNARGQGVVEALYDSLGGIARKRGWPFVRWMTADDNDRARAVYDRLSDKTDWVTYQMTVE